MPKVKCDSVTSDKAVEVALLSMPSTARLKSEIIIKFAGSTLTPIVTSKHPPRARSQARRRGRLSGAAPAPGAGAGRGARESGQGRLGSLSSGEQRQEREAWPARASKPPSCSPRARAAGLLAFAPRRARRPPAPAKAPRGGGGAALQALHRGEGGASELAERPDPGRPGRSQPASQPAPPRDAASGPGAAAAASRGAGGGGAALASRGARRAQARSAAWLRAAAASRRRGGGGARAAASAGWRPAPATIARPASRPSHPSGALGAKATARERSPALAGEARGAAGRPPAGRAPAGEGRGLLGARRK